MENVDNMNRIRPVVKNNPDRLYIQQGYLMMGVSIISFIEFFAFIFSTFSNVYQRPLLLSITFILTIMCLWDGTTIVRAGKYYGSWLTLPSPRWFISEDYRAIMKNRERIEKFLLSIDTYEEFGPLSESQLIEKLNRNGIPLKDHAEINLMLEELRHCVNQARDSNHKE
jgi:hypothetical protein